MSTVKATSFRTATAQEWQTIIERGNRHYIDMAGKAVLQMLEQQRDQRSPEGWPVNNYEHSLQCASRALRAGESEEFVVCALLHDVAQDLDPLGHDKIAAALLKPFVDEAHHWMVEHHQSFQLKFRTHSPFDQQASECWVDHPHYGLTYRFCELYDQNSFDPSYPSLLLETFAPMVIRLFRHPMQNRIDRQFAELAP